VVDDEPQIRHVLRTYLEHGGFEVVDLGGGAAAVAELGRAAAEGASFALVLLDVGLPDIDGLEVLRVIRATERLAAVPVILVTARAEEVDTLVGLAVGADDYITKPFSPREVVARVKTVLRRSGHPSTVPAPEGEDVVHLERLVIDRDRHEVVLDGFPVELSALEFDLLATLAFSSGRVFSRAQLLQTVWGYDYYGDERVVDVHIRSIRRALGDDAGAPAILGTVRGVGYKLLLAPVRSR
jgi:DNA-binding response OmpR family regulator